MYEFLLAGGVAIWVVVVWLYARSPVASIYHPATYYLFFHGFIFVFRPICGWLIGYQSLYKLYEFNPSMDVKQTVLIGANLGFVAFMAAVMYVGRVAPTMPALVSVERARQRVSRVNLLVASALLAPLGLAAQIANLRSGAKDETQVLDAATGTFVNTTGNGYFSTAATLLGVLTVLIAWQYRFRMIAMLPFMGYVLVRVASGSSRWTFMMATASLCLFWLYDEGRKWPSGRIVALGAVILPIFALVGQQRDILISYLNGTPVRQDLFRDRFLEGMDYANMEYFEYLVRAIPEKTGTWGYFLNNIQVFTEPVPRVLWPGKPIGAPIRMWELFDYGFPIGMTNSLPGEGWAQLGYLGIALWCGLAGAVLGWFYSAFMRSRQSGYQVAIYLSLLPLSIQFFRDGTLLTAVRFSMWYLIILVLWVGIAKLLGTRSIVLRPAPTGAA